MKRQLASIQLYLLVHASHCSNLGQLSATATTGLGHELS